tara:strand:+ start:589 stop:1059 length:471 start_codon:yes stop_codon:yes gene_type:complete
MFASQRYKKEVKSIRNMLSDGEFTRTLLPEYHTFLVDIHTKMLSQDLSSLEESRIDKAIKNYEIQSEPEFKERVDKLLSKITKLKAMVMSVPAANSPNGFAKKQVDNKMSKLNLITAKIQEHGSITSRDAKYANELFKELERKGFSYKIKKWKNNA